MRGKLFLIVAIFGAIFLWNNNQNTCANSISCIKDLTGQGEVGAIEGEFVGKKVWAPTYLSKKFLEPFEGKQAVLGETAGEKRIEVDLTHQRLYAIEGNSRVFDFPVSSGKWYPTPTGEFKVWIKLKRAKMEGGNKAINTYYYLPNVPHIMYFYNDKTPKTRGFGLHGAYWHNNFGHPMSHGCVNLPLDAAEQLYGWANPAAGSNATYATAENPGTRVIIYGQAPKE